IDTLVFVPDGILRTIPFAALHDGDDFLVRRFATAVTPGLSLVAPEPLNREGIHLLAAGVSQPVQGHAALPTVATELSEVHTLFGGEVLLDEAFRADRFEHELGAVQPN